MQSLYRYGEFSGKTENTTIVINKDYINYCRKTHQPKDKSFQYAEYQTNQKFEWDCGLACLNTLLSITENEHYNINHMHAMYYEYNAGLESLCWTIDYFLFVNQYVKPLSQTLFFSKHFGANDAYKTDPFYDGFDKEEERVNKAFEYAKEQKMKIYNRTLTTDEFRTLAAMEDIYMLVCVNDYYLECPDCCIESDEEELSTKKEGLPKKEDPIKKEEEQPKNDFQKLQKEEIITLDKQDGHLVEKKPITPFYGHFVLVIDIDFEQRHILWKDSQEGSCSVCRIDWDIFEKARFDHRTDGDTIVFNVWGSLHQNDQECIECIFFPAEELGYESESDESN